MSLQPNLSVVQECKSNVAAFESTNLTYKSYDVVFKEVVDLIFAEAKKSSLTGSKHMLNQFNIMNSIRWMFMPAAASDPQPPKGVTPSEFMTDLTDYLISCGFVDVEINLIADNYRWPLSDTWLPISQYRSSLNVSW